MNVLKTLSQYRNSYVYLALALFLLILASYTWWIGGLLIIYGVFLWKQKAQLVKVVLILCLLYMVRLSLVNQEKLPLEETHQMKVVAIEIYPHSARLDGKIKGQKVRVFYQGSHLFQIGEVYDVILSEKEDKNPSIPYTFQADLYLKGQGIKGTYNLEEFTYVKKTVHINQLHALLEERIVLSSPKSHSYIKTMVLADSKDLNEDTLEAIRALGVSHLFAVSGLHIGFLVLILKKGLSFVFKDERYLDLSLAGFLLIYLVLTSFTPSVARASLMVVFLLLNKYLKLSLDPLDIVSLVFLFLLFVHPFYYLQVGFQLSFLMTFFILLGRPLLQGRSKVSSAFYLSCFALFSTLPFTLGFQQSVNLLTTFYNLIYSFIVMLFLLPMSYLCLFFPILDSIFYLGIVVFEESVRFFSTIDFLVFPFVMNHLGYYLIYYLLLVLVLIGLEEKKRVKESLLMFGFFILFLLNQEYFVFFSSVHFVDVYGDATLVQSSFDRCNILVDTGDDDDYDGLITYIKNQHVKRIDYLIISHHHDDHFGELEDILREFHVVNYIDKYNVDAYPNLLECGNIQVYFYEMAKDYANENNNSLVMSMYVGGEHYLFTGDMEGIMEEEFMERYEIGFVDKLKVAHHGSITSSSEEWLDYVRPKEAYMIVSLRNTHGHPSLEVVKRYETRDIALFRTDLSGTIEIRYVWKKEWKKTSK